MLKNNKVDSTTPEANGESSETTKTLQELTENTAKEVKNLNSSIEKMVSEIENLVQKRDILEENINNSKITITKLSESLTRIKTSDEKQEVKDMKLKAICIGLNKLQVKYTEEKNSHLNCQKELFRIHNCIKYAVEKTEFLKKRLNRIGKSKEMVAVA